jgi:hypothetical protein
VLPAKIRQRLYHRCSGVRHALQRNVWSNLHRSGKADLKQIPNIWVSNFDLIAYTSGTVVLILFISVVLGGTAVVSRESQTNTVPERT